MSEKESIQKIVQETVKETLKGLGFTVDTPHVIQEDLIYLHKMRQGSEEISRLIRRSVITVTIPAFLYLMWEAFKELMK